MVGLSTQVVQSKSFIEPFNPSVGSEYSDFDLISKANLPTLDALDNAKKSLLR